MGVAEKGLSEQSLIEFFLQLDGFLALRYSSSGKAGGMCFAKFANTEQAAVAKDLAASSSGYDMQIARTTLNPAQATYVVS